MPDPKPGHSGDEIGCPEHGKTLTYARDQGDDEYEMREHLECEEPDCGYEVWA
jgi:hypothetical protein